MNVVALNGSPRRTRGTTMLILEPFLRGLHEGGAKVELIHLSDLAIASCRECFECWFKSPGRCAIQDEMEVVLARLRQADLWVFATDVYWGGASGLLKTAMDRMLPLVEPLIETEKGGGRNRLREGSLPGKFVLVASCEHWEASHFDPLVAQMEFFCSQIGRQYAGALLRPHGFALSHMMWLGKETAPVLDAAQKLGGQMAEKGALPEKVLMAVGAKLMPQEVYVRHINDVAKKGLAAMAAGQRRAANDTLEIRTVPHPFKFKSGKNPELNGRIVDAINRMGGVGAQAEQEYQKSIEALRVSAREVVAVVAGEYDALPEGSYLDRWSLVHLMSELGHPAALPVLDRIIDTPIPAERSKVLHEYSTRAEELVIRTTCIEGIKRIAAQGNEEALKLLLKNVKHEEFSVRRAAVQGYLEAGGPDAEKKLLKVLADKDKRLLEIRRRDVREISQPVIFDVTAPKKRGKRLPLRADEIPANQRAKTSDSPRTGDHRQATAGKGDDKPCCGQIEEIEDKEK